MKRKKVKILGLSYSQSQSGSYVLVLSEIRGGKKIPVIIKPAEAQHIAMKLENIKSPRPMTHDLLTETLGELDAQCVRVSITELRDNTFYASITIATGDGREIEIDSRPSDALALAVRSGAPIFAAEDVVEESSIEFEHENEDTDEVVEKFKEFLEDVSPEDFAGGQDG